MPFAVGVEILKQELVLSATTRMNAPRATQGSDLVQEGALTIQTRVVTKPVCLQIMETNTSKPWDISWYNREDYSQIKHSSLTHLVPAPLISRFTYALSALALYLPFCYKSPADSWNLISRC